MKMLLIIASLLIGHTALAQETAPPAKPGKIIVYRTGTIIGAAGSCPVRHKNVEVMELGRGKFAEWQVAPGRYILTNKLSSIEVNVAPGEIRYVRCQIKMGFLGDGGAHLQIVERESFEAVQDDLERKEILTTTGDGPSTE
ncbi:MAG: hypothetical protein ACOY4P_00025 [Pseudomonadota bacterium]